MKRSKKTKQDRVQAMHALWKEKKSVVLLCCCIGF